MGNRKSFKETACNLLDHEFEAKALAERGGSAREGQAVIGGALVTAADAALRLL